MSRAEGLLKIEGCYDNDEGGRGDKMDTRNERVDIYV